MGHKNREIEWKLLAAGHSNIQSVEKIIRPLLPQMSDKFFRPTLNGCAADIYWNAPEDSQADFVRLRSLDDPDANGNMYQITLKSSDKGDNVNRIEVDLGVSSHDQANKLLTLMLGDPVGQVTKRYVVFFLENEHTTISIYRVMRDKRVFVEVEATTLKRVKEVTKLLTKNGLSFSRVPQSLFDVFVAKKEMTPEEIIF